MFGAAWTTIFVFPRLMVSPKSLDAAAKSCRRFSLCAMSAKSSANRASILSFSTVFARAKSLWVSKTEPFERYLTIRPGLGLSLCGVGPARRTS